MEPSNLRTRQPRHDGSQWFSVPGFPGSMVVWIPSRLRNRRLCRIDPLVEPREVAREHVGIADHRPAHREAVGAARETYDVLLVRDYLLQVLQGADPLLLVELGPRRA